MLSRPQGELQDGEVLANPPRKAGLSASCALGGPWRRHLDGWRESEVQDGEALVKSFPEIGLSATDELGKPWQRHRDGRLK